MASTDESPFHTPKLSELPPLPPSSEDDDLDLAEPSNDLPADSSGLDLSGSSDVGSASALLDRETRRKLMEIESSFLPEEGITTIKDAEAVHKGADDTFLFGGSPGNTKNLRLGTLEEAEEPRTSDNSSVEPPTPASAYKTPYPHRKASSNGEAESSDVSLSPSAAAAQRAHLRVQVDPAEDDTTPGEALQSRDAATTEEDEDDQPLKRSFSRTSQTQHHNPEANEPTAHYIEDQTSVPSPIRSPDIASESTITSVPSPAMPLSRRIRRPASLRSRQASARSSTSNVSLLSRSDASDATLGADFAIQSGGAAPAGLGARAGMSVSRLPSFGSIAGSIHSSQGGSQTGWSLSRSSSNNFESQQDESLGRLDEERDRAMGMSPPETPRPFNHSNVAPTDTVIAQHVRDIKVPETIEREYREKHAPDGSTRGLGLSLGRKNNLTLKEQNSKIDKLSKENFDLKLKIHFLDQALQNRSDEGVKDMIGKNVQLQTDLATEKKDNQSLRRKIRELERKVKQQEEGIAARQVTNDVSGDEHSDHSEQYAEMEEEIIILREVVHQSEVEIERLRQDNLAKEVDKRRLAEYVKTMSDVKPSESRHLDDDSTEMWRELLETETARREQADLDAAKLREEIQKLKAEIGPATTRHVRNTYNINKRHTLAYTSRSHSAQSETASELNGPSDSRSSTAVETLRHENAELRRDLSAQTQMLTSRNRERERLQQEIEDLKLHQRRDGVRSAAGDSILERSVSRAHQRSSSRASGMTRVTQVSDQERDDYEKREADLRDQVAQIKMVNQDLERELNAHLDILQTVETENANFKEEKALITQDLQALQGERDEALEALQDKEDAFDQLREEALATIDELEEELKQKEQDFAELQSELKSVSESLIRLEDELSSSRRKGQTISQALDDNETELTALEEKLRDTIGKNEVLDVQLESAQNEIAFLREEQDADKIKIGELEAGLNSAQSQVHEEKERMRETEARLAEERQQRDAIDDEQKQAVQQRIDELSRDHQKSTDEVRKLKKSLQDKQTEASTWKERLQTLEGNLREALGDLDGTRGSLLKDVTKLTRDLEHTLAALDISKTELAERTRILASRDALLETTGLENRKLTDLLDKERSLRQKERVHFDNMQRSQQSLTRTIQQNDTRAAELENALSKDRKRWSVAEKDYRDQVLDRNTLLLQLWQRLAPLCGPRFAQKLSIDNIQRDLAGFSSRVHLVAKTVETIVFGFRDQIREVERSLSKDFQSLEHAMDVRTKRIDHLEEIVENLHKPSLDTPGVAAATPPLPSNGGIFAAINPRSSSRGSMRSPNSELAKLKNENKILKAELQLHRQTSPTREGAAKTPSSRSHAHTNDKPHNHFGHSHKNSIESAISAMPLPKPRSRENAAPQSSHRHSISTSLLRHPSSSTVDSARYAEQLQTVPRPSSGRDETGSPVQSGRPLSTASASAVAPSQDSDKRWVHRLRELEKRLKAEREARLLDRSGARKRIEEERDQKEELRRMLEREKERGLMRGRGEEYLADGRFVEDEGDGDGGAAL